MIFAVMGNGGKVKAEYIERKSALEICEKEYQDRLRMLDYCGDTVAWNIAAEINEIPSADVAPVVHGRWILYPRPHYFKCSKCKYTVPYKKAYAHNGGREYNYCPHCGAKMDGAENE